MDRYLLIRYRKMGDTLMATPVIQSLAKEAKAEVFTVGERGWSRIFTSMPEVTGGVDVSGGNPSYWECLQVGLQARKFRCERALVLRFSNRAALIARVAGCKVRVGGVKRQRPSMWALTHNVADSSWWALPQVEKYYRVAEAASGRSLVRRPTVYQPSAEAKLETSVPAGSVVVHLGNGGSNLAWPDDRFAALISALQQSGRTVITTGDAREAARYATSAAAADINLVGKTPLDALANVYRDARLVVALDGGGCRLASAVGTPIVNLAIGSMWSPEIVAPWMAPGEVVEPDRRCDGCSLGKCVLTGQTCIDQLPVEKVLAACQRQSRA